MPAPREISVPYNRTTGELYRGKNILRLCMVEAERGWETAPGWAGYRQWVEHGRVVRKGEHATIIFTMVTVPDRKTGEPKAVPGKPRRVFHFAQTVELESPTENGE